MRVRFGRLKAAVHSIIVDDNAFGLAVNGVVINKVGTFSFTRSADKHASFMEWLHSAQDKNIFSIRTGTPFQTAASSNWMNLYIDSSYQRGIAQAAGAMRKGGASISERWVDAGFNRSIHADALALIYNRNYSALEGITDAMDASISRILAEGLAYGKGPMALASEIEDAIDSIGEVRAETLARTEVINAHAESTLNSYEEAGIEGVTVDAEFTTSDDDAVCPICDDMNHDIYTIDDARGVIPVHPNCRCAWLPSMGDDDTEIELE